MKRIELTEEQKNKLLEMCNTLFPDTKWHFWETDDDDIYPDNQMIGYNSYYILGKSKKMNPALEIHWFEFCLLHLAEKISGERILQLSVGKSIKTKEHIIDTLYEIFKK